MSSKEARKEARKQAVEQLGQSSKALEKLSKKCKLYSTQLRSKTEATVSRIRAYYTGCRDDADRLRFLRHFLAQWFINFIGCKDEAMVLLKGELTRSYHVEEHAQYMHSRGEQNKWYKSDKLSSCSVDGWRYEHLRTKDTLGSSSSLEEALDGHADRVDTVSDMLDPLIESMDECGEVLRRGLQSLQPPLAQLILDLSSKLNHHLGERMCVQLKEDAPEMSVKWTRKSAQKVSREKALSTTLEDPLNAVPAAAPAIQSNGNGSSAAMAAPLNIANSMRRNVIVDEDDVENQEIERKAVADKAARAERARKAAEDDFSMIPVSIDEIKMKFGATHLLAMGRVRSTEEEGGSEDEQTRMKVVPEQVQEQKPSTQPQQTQYEANLKDLLAHKNKTVATLHPGLPDPSNRVIIIHLIVPGDRCSVLQMKMTVSRGAWATEGEVGLGADEYPHCVDATEVLDEVYRRVWSLFDASGKQVPLPLLPRVIHRSLEDTTSYAHGALVPVPMPVSPDGEPAPLFVFCVDSAAVQAMLKRLAARVTRAQAEQQEKGVAAYDDYDERDTILQRELRATARSILPIVPNVILVERLAAALKTHSQSPIKFDLSNLDCTLLQDELTVDHIMNELHLLTETHSGCSTEEKERREDGDGARQQLAHAGVDLNLSMTVISGTLLFELLPFANKISIDSCSLDAYELRVCAACLAEQGKQLREEARSVGTKSPSGHIAANHAALPKLQELNISYNDLFENFPSAAQFAASSDDVADDSLFNRTRLSLSYPIEMFFVELFLAAPALAVLDASHCCPNQKKKYPQALASALVSASQRRVEEGFVPLTTLNIRGLRDVAAHTSGRHALDVDRDFLERIKLAMPNCCVDVEGLNLKIF